MIAKHSIAVGGSLTSEELALTFDHFRLHRSAWKVLSAVKEATASELKRIYGPLYIENESQLPFVTGYVFMTATRTQKVGKLLLPKKENVVSSMLLMQAAEILKVMIQTDAGGLEVNILRDKYDLGLEAEREGEESIN